jgi:hypothetical protein
MHDERCALRRLACGRHCAVDRCNHGTVHLRLGALSLHLTTDQLGSLAETLQAAWQSLDAGGPSTATRAH